MNRDFIWNEPLVEYVERKVFSFLEKFKLGNQYSSIKEKAKKIAAGNMILYFNELLTDTVSKVAEAAEKDWDSVKEEFNCHYLS